MPVKAISSIGRLQVVADGEGLTSRAGTALVAGVADQVGLTAGLSAALEGLRERRSGHDRGRVVRDLALTLADGGDCLADLRVLRDQEPLFGGVASDATGWRTLAALDERRLQAIRAARADARGRVWERAGAPERVILDLDGTLLTAHSDKEGAAGTYKGGFGFHPLLCYEATSEEALAGLLRPGNAGFNTASDHIELLEQALAQLPEQTRSPGLLVRCDRAGATHAFLDHVAERGFRFSVGLDLTEPVREAILALPERAWQPAAAQDGADREGAWVAELPLELSAWPAGTRAICRRERPHPGAQLLHRRERLPLPGFPDQPAGVSDRPPRAAAPRSRRLRGPDPLRTVGSLSEKPRSPAGFSGRSERFVRFAASAPRASAFSRGEQLCKGRLRRGMRRASSFAVLSCC